MVLDDIEPIVFHQENVLRVLEDYIVEEEIMNDNSVIRLNDNQIVNEITNLLYEHYRQTAHENIARIPERVQLYFSMLSSKPIDVSKDVAMKKMFPEIVPIVSHLQKEYIYKDDVYDQKEYAEENDKVLTPFAAVMNQMQRLFKSSEAADIIKRRLDTFFTPFVAKSGNYTTMNTDNAPVDTMYQHKDGSHAITRLLEGDKTHIIGYMHSVSHGNNRPLQEMPEHKTMDVSKYVQKIKSFSEGTHVWVIPKDFNENGEAVAPWKGTIVKRDAEEEDGHHSWIVKPYQVGIKKKISEAEDTTRGIVVTTKNALVYTMEEDVERVVLPDDLVTGCIRLIGTEEEIRKYVYPQTISQYLYLFREDVKQSKTWEDVYTMLKKIGLSKNVLSSDIEHVVREPVTRRYAKIENSKEPLYKKKYIAPEILHLDDAYPYRNKYFDGPLTRIPWLIKRPTYVLKNIKEYRDEWYQERKREKFPAFVKKRIQQIQKEIAKLEDEIATLSKKIGGDRSSFMGGETLSGKVVKVYTSQQACETDSSKGRVYVNETLDDTPYHLHNEYTDDHELKEAVRQYYEKRGEHLSTAQLQELVQTVRSNKYKRHVRIGELAILRAEENSGDDIVYEWKMVQEAPMWVRIKRLNGQWQLKPNGGNKSPTLLSSQQQGGNGNHAIPPVTEEEMKKAHCLWKKTRLEEEADNLEHDLGVFMNWESVSQMMIDDIQHYANVEQLKKPQLERAVATSIQTKEEDNDGEYGAELDEAIAAGEAILEFNDQNHYAFMPQISTDPDSIRKKKLLQSSFVYNFCSFLGFDIDTNDVMFIDDWAATKIDVRTERLVQVEKARLRKSINQTLYAKDEGYRNKVDALIEKKLMAFGEKVYAKEYETTALHSIAMLSLIIMSKYPVYLISNIYPACVRLLSYKSYPLVDAGKKKTLLLYFACVLKFISDSEDPRYAKILEMDVEEMNNTMVKYVDEILVSHPALDVALRMNEGALGNMEDEKAEALKEVAASDVWHGFRPFVSTSTETANTNVARSSTVSKFISRLNGIQKKQQRSQKGPKSLYKSLTSGATSCCHENITSYSSYLEFFYANDSSLRTLYDALPRKKYTSSRLQSVIPPLKKTVVEKALPIKPYNKDALSSTHVHIIHTNTPSVPSEQEQLEVYTEIMEMHDEILGDVGIQYENEDYWNETVVQGALRNLETVLVKLANKTIAIDTEEDRQRVNEENARVSGGLTVYGKELFDFIKYTLVLMKTIDMENISLIQKILKTFLTYDVPTILTLLENGYHGFQNTIKLVDTSISQMIYELQNTEDVPAKKIIDVIAEVRTTLLEPLRNIWIASDPLKHIILMTYVLCKMIHDIVTTTEMPTLGMYIAYKLKEKLGRNHVDGVQMKKRIEELREKRKEELIALYKVDDEERELQMALKRLGVQTWFDVGGNAEEDENRGAGQLVGDMGDIGVVGAADAQEEDAFIHVAGQDDDEDDDAPVLAYEAIVGE